MNAVLEKENELPDGWEEKTIGDLCTIVTGKLDVNQADEGGKYPFFTCAKEIYAINDYAFDAEAVLVAGNGFFNVKYYKGQFNAYQRTYVLHDIKVDAKFLYYLVDHRLKKITSGKRGSTIQYIRLGDLRDHPVWIAPPEQQKRIVAKIEELFSHIDAGIEALKKAKQLLKQYRQSVLKAAVTGELTKEWRAAQGSASVAGGRTSGATEAESKGIEPASKLLERILETRRQLWEQRQLEQFKAKGLPAPKKDRWWLYVILCDDNSFYIGVTEDMPRRWNEHTSGKGAEHTKKHKPISIIHHEEFKSQKEAYNREKELKTGFGRKWLKREYEKGALRQAGKIPKDDNWKLKYKELEAIDDSELDKLPNEWLWTKNEQLGAIQLGRQRSPKYHNGPNMRPYLRVQNIFEDRIDLDDVMEMEFSPSDFEKYALKYNDVLLNEGQSPELLGRPAIYRNELPGVCFTNTLIRFQAADGLLPEYALLVYRYCMHSGRFTKAGTITTNIGHLSAGRFSQIEFPLCSTYEQKEVVNVAEDKFIRIERLEKDIAVQLIKAEKNKQSVLASAFLGELN